MSYRRLDAKGKPIPRDGRTSRKPASMIENGVTLYHYEIAGAIPLTDGKRRQYRQRFWLPDDHAADEKEREILHKPPAKALTWVEAHRRWLEENRGKFSPGHVANSHVTIRQWCKAFGAHFTIAETTLADFAGWVAERAKEGKGRGAQIKRGHLLAIGRWARGQGLVDGLAFEHAPQPEARTEKRRPASVGEFAAIADILPSNMRPMWLMMGVTGMRISAACDLVEDDITDAAFTVTTKGGKRVTYKITPEIAQVISEARKVKAQGYLVGRGKDKRAEPILSKYLFNNNRGVKWTKRSFSERLNKCLRNAKLPKVTSHQLRHMAGTLMAEKNLSADIIKAGLGHASRESAESYIDQTEKMREQALSAIADSLQIFDTKNADLPKPAPSQTPPQSLKKNEITCPHCGHKFNADK